MQTQETVRCADAVELKVTKFHTSQTDQSIVIASAFGVSQTFYWPFADALSKLGYVVYCFDYRGTGLNAHVAPTKLALTSWGKQDINAVIAHAANSSQAVHFIGHSIGGQLVGLAPQSDQLNSLVLVAASAPYWRRWPKLSDKLKIQLNATILLPLVSRCYRSFPSSKFGLGNLNLPPSAVRQWAQWMRKPDYLFAPQFKLASDGFKTIRCPILSLGFSDDKLAPKRNIDHLLKFFVNAPIQTQTIRPEDGHTKHIGHTGFFKPKFANTLWKDVVHFVQTATPIQYHSMTSS